MLMGLDMSPHEAFRLRVSCSGTSSFTAFACFFTSRKVGSAQGQGRSQHHKPNTRLLITMDGLPPAPAQCPCFRCRAVGYSSEHHVQVPSLTHQSITRSPWNLRGHWWSHHGDSASVSMKEVNSNGVLNAYTFLRKEDAGKGNRDSISENRSSHAGRDPETCLIFSGRKHNGIRT